MRQAVSESTFRPTREKIRGQMREGDVYGYFVTEEEFARLRDFVVSSGHLGGLNWQTDRIHLMHSEESRDLDPEFIKKIERGEFIVGSEEHLTELLAQQALPKGKIGIISALCGFPD